MQTTQYLTEIIRELQHASEQIQDEQAELLVNDIIGANKIFVAGAGRSGFMAKSFAMRMMHMGIQAFVVGETVTPSLEKDDLLIIGSGSGETKTLVSMAEKAASIGAKIAVVTIHPESTIGKLADVIVALPGAPKDQTTSSYQTIQPMGSLFEQTLLLFFDALIVRFMEKKELDTQTMYGKHANLE
ncbi:6-phospho-3-hexuloisomerase [Halalkalibacter akibai]|uniref:6-phospho-3-hexuloisomerase n=1 Tax=Halalkalibacter akibai (strain ATCC 43226 / DSM 21942 / CIP 109018 / JCM 9157 / 1139) TaxID=1236973 RepID=W4QX79_HALA3|nr:6-phospho-3-hexuloisomerase [Halalkalibacter akibai]GAE35909.1 6-phospho-3-hexuloisomerase [Halalkalibacter akibai JCM 9157]